MKFDFFKNYFNKIHLLDLLIKDAFINLLITLGDQLNVFFILRVAQGVMTEVETLRFLYLTAHPLTEVCVVDLALFLMIFVNDKLCKVFKIHFFVLTAEKAKDVIHSYKSIVVTVKI